MRKSDTQIVFWGTPEFALPTLEALAGYGWRIAAVVTNPDEPAGRTRTLTPPPVKTWISNQESRIKDQENGIKVLQPERLDENFQREILNFKPDIFIVAAYGKIIPKKILDIPESGALNLHPSLLPRWRGPSPIQYAILAGDAQTGVTIMQMDDQMDHGPIAAQRKTQSLIRKIAYPELHDELARLGAELLVEVLPKWLDGKIETAPQDHASATYSKLLAREDGRVDWSKPAAEIERMVRAFTPWPGGWTVWTHGVKSLRLRIEDADWIPNTPAGGTPGLVWGDATRPLCVQGGAGSLVIKKLGAEGKNITDAAAFIRGYAHIIGAILV